MNDEIKEILDEIEDYSKHEYLPPCCELTNEECKQLLDYITNLQQENEYLKKNQRFHKKFGNDYIFCLEGDKETYRDLIFELQERIDKAIEYIKEHSDKLKTIRVPKIDYNYEILLKILKGDSNE